jgi:hypothetical protein
VKFLSRDHKPDLPDEKERILRKGGKVERIRKKNKKIRLFR